MKKFFTLLFIFLFTFCFSLEVSAITLKGRVTYQSKEVKDALANVDEVRKEAFENSQQSFDVSSHKKHFNDPFYRENKRFAKKKVSYTIGDFSRFITHFSDDSYCISYDDTPDITYHYNGKGKLEFIGYNINLKISHKYNLEGKLARIIIYKKKSAYVFTTDGKLLALWIGPYAYNSNGQIILKRW